MKRIAFLTVGYFTGRQALSYYKKSRKPVASTEELNNAYNRNGLFTHDFQLIYENRNRVENSRYWLQHMLNKYPCLMYNGSLGLCLWRFGTDLENLYTTYTPAHDEKNMHARYAVYKDNSL